MTAFESMSEKLSKTGLYSTAEGKMVYAELMAYAEGLDIYYNALKELLRECFVSTAQNYGLTMREKYICKCPVDDSTDSRRNSIIAALSVCNNDFTYDGFQKCLKIWGVEGTLKEDCDNKKFIFECTTPVSDDKLQLIKQQVKAFLPCYFEFEWKDMSEQA
ncbi:MAG: hypothetical protein PUG48_02570 [Clostridia bacterium]|nr:hypothetical protein [Clostridia bacterium]